MIPHTHSFHVQRRLAKDNLLRTLSGDALRLYIFLSYKTFRIRKTEHLFKDAELTRDTGISQCRVAQVRSELQECNLIRYSVPAPNLGKYNVIQDLKPIQPASTDINDIYLDSSPAVI
jgi:hypothetical protein